MKAADRIKELEARIEALEMRLATVEARPYPYWQPFTYGQPSKFSPFVVGGGTYQSPNTCEAVS